LCGLVPGGGGVQKTGNVRAKKPIGEGGLSQQRPEQVPTRLDKHEGRRKTQGGKERESVPKTPEESRDLAKKKLHATLPAAA